MVTDKDARKIGSLVFLSLRGHPPERAGLAPLPKLTEGINRVSDVLRVFLEDHEAILMIEDIKDIAFSQSSRGSLVFIYVVGHAWLDSNGVLSVAILNQGKSEILSAEQLVGLILPQKVDEERTIVVFDTCFALGFDEILCRRNSKPLLAIYGSGVDEPALIFPKEDASRLMLAFVKALSSRNKSIIDITRMVSEIAEDLSRDGQFPEQTVSYSMHGYQILVFRQNVISLRK